MLVEILLINCLTETLPFQDTTELLSIEEFLNLPVQQLAFYENAFTTTLDNYERIDQEPAEDNDYLATLATVEVKMKEMHKKAEEIVKIYEIFDDNVNAIQFFLCYRNYN